MNNSKLKLPPCGMLIGSPVYLDRGDYVFQHTGPYYTSWVSEDHPPEWYLDKIIEDHQGNLAIIWDGRATKVCLKSMADWMDLQALGYEIPEPDWENKRFLLPEDWDVIAEHPERFGAGFHRLAAKATELGLYCYSIYSEATPEWVEKISGLDGFIGYNLGEKFSFDLEGINESSEFRAEKLAVNVADELETIAQNFQRSVRTFIAEKADAGWQRFFITSASFHLDAEIAAAQAPVIPHVEGFAFHNLNFGSALCRGLFRQFDLPAWGNYLAHEHYSFLPYASEYKFKMLDMAFMLSYMSGSKITVLESGNWWQQSDHVDDTVMHETPKIDLGATQRNDPRAYAHLVKKARPYYPALGYDSDVCRKYRHSLADFYEFVEKEGTPEGQPEVNIAAIKGRYDFCSQAFNPNMAIAGAYKIAEKHPFWYEGAPERSWEIFRRVFYPLPNVLGPYKNTYFSGTPYGMTDIVSFTKEPSAEFLISNYKALLFTGWNTASESQYSLLKDYVYNGGILFLAVPHLAANKSRNHMSYAADNLINGGDFSDLCGVKIRKRSSQIYWMLATDNNCLELPKYKHFGPFATHFGDIEITGNPEVICVHDESWTPTLVRNSYGKGKVYFLNSWQYPGALDIHSGPGAEIDSQGIVGEIYRRIALDCGGTVSISDDGTTPGPNCRYITYSYFPSNQKTYLLNVDFDKSHSIYLHRNGTKTQLKLAPTEFRII